MASTRYTVEVDLEAASSSQALAILSVPPGSHVLDIGAGDGSVARRLLERGCAVTAVELDPKAASVAQQSCERVVVADVETLDLAASLDGASFDAVLLLDVLEHLRDPLATLTAAAGRLKPGGRLILSVPNVTHAALRLQLLAGHFRYTERGLLDNTHLRLFDREALEQLITLAQLPVLDRMRTTAGLTETEIVVDPDAFPPETVALALGGEDAETYQFIYVLGPRGAGEVPLETASLGEILQRRVTTAERLHAELEAYARSLEERLAELQEASQRAQWLETELRARMQELESQHNQLEHVRMDLAIKDAQLAQLQAELAPMRARLDRLEEVMGYARHRLVDRVSAATKRFPGVHDGLKRIAERAVYRR